MRNERRLASWVMPVAVPLVLLLAVSACLTSAQESGPDSQSDAAQFARGAQTWSNHCGRCHNMRDPQELRDDQWQAVMSHMRVRAALSGHEARDVLAFLQASN